MTTMRLPITSTPELEPFAPFAPARLTWESLVVEADPISERKRMPDVAERRARFQRYVKRGLAACLALCVIAAIVAFASDPASPLPSTAASTEGRSRAITSVEPLGGGIRHKAPHRMRIVASTRR